MDVARYAALFHSEAREHLDEVDRILLILEAEPNSKDSTTHFSSLFRSMHTIKGMAASMGYSDVERLAHELESRSEPLRNGEQAFSPEVLAFLFDETAELRARIESLVTGNPASIVESRHQSSLAQHYEEKNTAVEAPQKQKGVSIRLVDDCPLKGVRALVVMAKLHMLGKVLSTEPPEASWQEDSFRGQFLVRLKTDADDESLLNAVRSAGEVQSASIVTSDTGAAFKSPLPRTVRIDARRLDELLNLSGELAIARDRMLRSVESMSNPDRQVTLALRELSRLVGLIQSEVLQARLQPVSQVFDRFPRLVRDIAHDLGKIVRFSTEGGDIELDRSLLDAIGDPLLHLLRNALDHGLETPAERLSLGKSAEGELIIRAARDHGHIVIQVQDDGRGINRAKVLARARDQGLVAEDTETISDDELFALISRSGLSTSTSVSMLSGRGVGVDVVNTRVRSQGGRVELETIEGAGTVFTLRLPAALGVTRALIVEAGGRRYALPANNVEELVIYNEESMIATTNSQGGEITTVTVRETTISVIELSEFFNHGNVEMESGLERHLVIVGIGGQRAALLVDTLVGQQDVVAKPLDFVRGSQPWFSGATVLGDGIPALIVDLSSVLSTALRNGAAARQVSSQREETMVGAR